MDTVRAILMLPAEFALPPVEALTCADALIAIPPHDPERIAALLEHSPPLYLAAPPIESGEAYRSLADALQPGVYGVAAPAASSLDQLRYLESIIEDIETRAGIRPGLTAMGLTMDSPQAFALIPEALRTLSSSAGRLTWVAWNPLALAQPLGIPADSPTISHAAAAVVLAAAAHNLPAVQWTDLPLSGAQIASARQLGFRGFAVLDPADLPRLADAFPIPSQTESEEPNPEEAT